MALSFFASNNRITTPGYQYDAAGNLLMDNLDCYTYVAKGFPSCPPPADGDSPRRDAENRLTSVAQETSPGTGVCGATVMSYLYDPEGRRVAKVQNGAVVKQFYYDAAGQMIAETNASGALQRAEIFAGGRHLATWAGNATYFNHADWLGTERARTNSPGTLCETITSLPFGDGQTTTPQNGGCGDPSPNHFTGKERDIESGNDYFRARYYASSTGRFMTPDWATKPVAVPYASFGNPQSLNLYSYVLNNPTTATDSDGHSDYLWQKFRNWAMRNGYRTDAQVKGWTVAQTANNHHGSKDWAISGRNTSGMDVGHPQDFKPGQNKCNQFVGDTLAEAGKTRPELPDGKGGMRMPTAHELADPNVHIPGLSGTRPLSEARPDAGGAYIAGGAYMAHPAMCAIPSSATYP